MKSLLCFAVPFSLLGQVASADAATVARTFYGCRDQADEKKLVDALSKGATADLDKLAKPRLAAGSCINLGRGATVTIDEKKPSYFCVRLSGDLDCYWIADAFIDQKPHNPEETQRKQPTATEPDLNRGARSNGFGNAGGISPNGTGAAPHGFSTDLLGGGQ